MRRKTMSAVLSLFLILMILPIAPVFIAQAAPSGTAAAEAYKAYYNVLSEAADKYGIGLNQGSTLHPGAYSNEDYRDVYLDQGLLGALLLDFAGDGLPQLLYIYSSGDYESLFFLTCAVYGFSGGKAELYDTFWIGGEGGWGCELNIVTGQNGISYLHEIQSQMNFEYTEGEDEEFVYNYYHTAKDGKWHTVPEAEVDALETKSLERSLDVSSVRTVLGELESLPENTPSQPPAPSATLEALPSAWGIKVNGGSLRGTDMYNITGSNYLKIRDIASLLGGTGKKFNIYVDGQTVNMIRGESYNARGDEMTLDPDAVITTTSATTFTFTLNGQPVELTAYLIAGSNYVKIRDVLQLFDVFVDYDADLREFYIDTYKSYEGNSIAQAILFDEFEEIRDGEIFTLYKDQIDECIALDCEAFWVEAICVDLNNDGTDEVMSYFMSSVHSGSLGNLMLDIWVKDGGAYKNIGLTEDIFLNPHHWDDDGTRVFFDVFLYAVESPGNEYRDIWYVTKGTVNGVPSASTWVFSFDGNSYTLLE